MRFCQAILKILFTERQNDGITGGQGESSIAPLFQSGAIMTGNNPKLDLVNVDVHTKFGLILSNRSQDIERKRNSDINQGPLLHQNFAKNDGY